MIRFGRLVKWVVEGGDAVRMVKHTLKMIPIKFPCSLDQNSVFIILTRVGGWLEFDFIAISVQLDWDLG